MILKILLNFKIFNAKLSDQKVPEKNILIDDNKLFVGTKTNALELIEVQMEGKKIRHFLNTMAIYYLFLRSLCENQIKER